jgi:hypothetical protein
MPPYLQTLAHIFRHSQSGGARTVEPVEVERLVSEVEAALTGMKPEEENRVACDIFALHSHLARSLPTPASVPDAALARNRVSELRMILIERSNARHARARARIRQGGLRGADLLAWLDAYEPTDRDLALEHLLGIAHYTENVPQDPDLVGYVPSGITSIIRSIVEVPITSNDILVDVGAGLGKVAMAVHLLSGARTRGIELNPELVKHATSASAALGLGDEVSFLEADARDTDIGDATIVFMYVPFRGAALLAAMRRLEEAARRRARVICTLGLDLGRCEWLIERDGDDFWLSIYDTRPLAAGCPGREQGQH